MKFRSIFKTCISVICCGIFIFNFIGCRNYKKENREALEYLNNKYGEEFELDGNFQSVYGDEFYQSPEKETKAWPKDNPNKVFTVEIYPEDGHRDNYQNYIMEPCVKEYLNTLIKECWPDSKSFIYLKLGLINNKFNSNDFEEFLKDGRVIVYMYIYNNNTDFDVNKQAKIIEKLFNELKYRGINMYINISYSNDTINEIDINNKDAWKIAIEKGYISSYFNTEYNKYYSDINEEINVETIKQKLEKSVMEDGQ